MCMLCVIPPNVFPAKDKLENSALNNPDGFGYAIAIPDEKRILVFHSMNADECISKFMEDRAKYHDNYAIWHARFATHGANTLANCHPFKVGDDEMSYLAHNGILSVLEEKADVRSDTRIFAEDLIGSIGGIKALDNPQVWNMLEDFTTGSKVAFLTVNPVAKHQIYLLHEEKGTVDSSGVWWSNDTCNLYSSLVPYGSGYAYDYRTHRGENTYQSYLHDEEDEALVCNICYAVQDYWLALKEGHDSYCQFCSSCYDCGAFRAECLCYEPARVETNAWGGGR
jgi:hypothetical protein